MKDKQIIAWQRIEGLAILIVALFWYARYSNYEIWGLFIFLIFLPDISAAGYLFNTKIGAFCYNLVHSLALPMLVLMTYLISGRRIVLYLALAWLAHVGMDRAFGFGLKYDDDFKHTHLGFIGKKQ